MATDNLIPLNITIGDRNYRIKILPADEEDIRIQSAIFRQRHAGLYFNGIDLVCDAAKRK